MTFPKNLACYPLICLLLIACSLPARAQQEKKVEIDTTKRRFGKVFGARPKVASVSLKSVQNFKLNTASDVTSDEEADVSQNVRRDAYLRFPVYIKNSTLIGINLRYRHEKFRFTDPSNEDYQLFQKLEDNGLRSTGFDGILRTKDKKERTITARLGFRLNGDSFDNDPVMEFLKVSLFAIRSIKKNDYTSYGYGFSAGYDLGAFSVYPVFVYQHYFNKHLSVDLNLPKSASFIYGFSDKTFLTWTTELSGASYHVSRPLVEGQESLELRKSEVRSYLRLEREIYDFVWIGAELGGMQYLNFFVSKPGERRRNSLINLETNPAYFVKIGLFITVPKKVYNKIMN